MSATTLRIAIVYDRVYPASVGGAERVYRALAERLASAGHKVTYITADHWSPQPPPTIPGVDLVAVATQRQIYGARRRRIWPVLAFALAAARLLVREGNAFDAVHSSAMSPLLAFACIAAARRRQTRCVLDWWEVWPTRYWQQYLGPRLGLLGALAQRLVARSPHQPVTHARLHDRRLHQLRGKDDAVLLRGVLDMPGHNVPAVPARPYLLVAGRLIPEKQVTRLIPAITVARKAMPNLRAVIIGEGPDREAIGTLIRALHMEEIIEMPGILAEEVLREYMRQALCIVVLSTREGYGLVIPEAAAMGVPALVLAHEDSAVSEFITAGVNGAICTSTSPQEVAEAIARIGDAGYPLRERTLAWFRENQELLAMDASIPTLLRLYGSGQESA